MDQFTLVQKILIWLIPIIFAVSLHEAAHGLVAYKLGDDTAHQLGRISINPLKHIDIVGTIIIPLFLMLTSGFIFGWAKPVPVNPNRLRHPKRDYALVALAGPLANLLMALAWMGLWKYSLYLLQKKIVTGLPLLFMSQAGVTINIILMVLNLIPIPPLDGSRFISYLLPAPWDAKFDRITPFGILIVIALIATGILGKILIPANVFVLSNLLKLFNISA